MYCTNCGAQNIDTAKFCAKCGTKLVKPIHPTQPAVQVAAEPPTVSRRSRRRTVLMGLGILVGIAAIVGFAAYQRFKGPEGGSEGEIASVTLVSASPTSTTHMGRVPMTPTPIVTFPPPLANVEFSVDAVDYPRDWPAELRYPEAFTAVELSSGVLPGGDARGWAAKLRYEGDPKSAADLLTSFLAARGWQIAERTELDSGGLLVLLETNGKEGTGIVVIGPDPNDAGYTRVLATVSP
jgi:hypothetical protein